MMFKHTIQFTKGIGILLFHLSIAFFSSCNGQANADSSCIQKFKEAQNLLYNYAASSNQSNLDSALVLTNESLKCDPVKKDAVELKIRLLMGMKKYSEGMRFVGSLNETDFTFKYKKKAIYNTFLALEYESKKDTFNGNLIYKNIADYLEEYIKKNNVINGKEFEEIYLDLYAVKAHFLDSAKIDKEIDSLEKKYPDKAYFFSFLKKPN